VKRSDEEIKKESAFLEKITNECSEELKFDINEAKKLLRGDLSVNTRKAKVRESSKLQ
jgi:hypothetical protein